MRLKYTKDNHRYGLPPYAAVCYFRRQAEKLEKFLDIQYIVLNIHI